MLRFEPPVGAFRMVLELSHSVSPASKTSDGQSKSENRCLNLLMGEHCFSCSREWLSPGSLRAAVPVSPE